MKYKYKHCKDCRNKARSKLCKKCKTDNHFDHPDKSFYAYYDYNYVGTYMRALDEAIRWNRKNSNRNYTH